MVERDQNHASVLAWSIAQRARPARMTEDQADYIRRAARLLDRLDPTRLRTIDIFGWPQNPPADVYHRLDAIGINNYFGWYPGPNGQTEDRSRLGPFLDQMREYYPELALFVTEFGAEANRERPRRREGHLRVPAASSCATTSRPTTSKRYLNGAVAWILRDFRVAPRLGGRQPHAEAAAGTRRAWWTTHSAQEARVRADGGALQVDPPGRPPALPARHQAVDRARRARRAYTRPRASSPNDDSVGTSTPKRRRPVARPGASRAPRTPPSQRSP